MLGKKDYLSGGYIFNFKMVDYLRIHGLDIEVIHFRTVPGELPERWFTASLHVLRRINAAKPDIVIVSKSYQFVPLFRLLKPFFGYPVVYMMHHLEWKDTGNKLRAFMYRRYVSWLLGMADLVWTNSRSTMKGVIELGIPEDRLRMINPGFEKIGDEPPDRSSREGPIRILCVGSMSPRKGQHLLVEACIGLDRSFFTIEFAGSTDSDEDYADSVYKLIEREGMWDSVKISGNLTAEKLVLAYGKADILVHPASWEAFGISILEGMWHGLPVISSSIAAIPELVRHEDNGLLVTPGDSEELRNAILYLVQHRDLRLNMGRRSREYAMQQNDWNDTQQEFMEMLRSAVKESNR